ncbi:MAG TPA: hypothetical protein VFM46_02495 [Pseudomonadales bacterium]|nr:hypothetical protein [Pseudomonadales bacterium]
MKKSIEKNVIRELDLNECQQVGGGYLGPDQNVSDFPVWALPRILVAINASTIAAKTAQLAAH